VARKKLKNGRTDNPCVKRCAHYVFVKTPTAPGGSANGFNETPILNMCDLSSDFSSSVLTIYLYVCARAYKAQRRTCRRRRRKWNCVIRTDTCRTHITFDWTTQLYSRTGTPKSWCNIMLAPINCVF